MPGTEGFLELAGIPLSWAVVLSVTALVAAAMHEGGVELGKGEQGLQLDRAVKYLLAAQRKNGLIAGPDRPPTV